MFIDLKVLKNHQNSMQQNHMPSNEIIVFTRSYGWFRVHGDQRSRHGGHCYIVLRRYAASILVVSRS